MVRARAVLIAVIGLILTLWGVLTPADVSADPPGQHSAGIEQWVNDQVDSLIEIYQDFHAHPEVSFEEAKTAQRLAGLLKSAGYEVTTEIGGHGLVAILQNGEGPTVMLRTDLDGLPVTENTELVYASKQTVKLDDGSQSGVMHACGHDIHMTNVVGTARYMAAHRNQWHGTLMIIGQPAEEKGQGAKAMLQDGLFERFPKPDYAIALHVDPNLPTGTIGYRSGYAMANVDSVDIYVQGQGGHGAHPDATVDPIVQAAQLILDLQTIVSREINPTEPAVVTVGAIHGGTKHNIIGNECHLQLTVRSYGEKVRKQLLEAIQRKAKAVAISYRAPEPKIVISEGTPSLFNDKHLTWRIVENFNRTFGDEKVVPVDPSMGGEDFSRYGIAGVPIFMYRLGSVDAKRLARYEQLGQEPPSLHSPLYYPDAEACLTTGVNATVSALLELFEQIPDDQ
ncbi:M20 metallopeptidase family protein [Bremerella alba]|uniref:N-acetyldiaminopimelate deacetylase n=1 Tax=Bremerella alba TaxID=980252 RepID=A0A7V8V6J2_9BACT|nr:amidohydrolase [Bremerella alba]MBA2115629.1 N-acetyldiaminopimelate deacetylase [Bremerella alba]